MKLALIVLSVFCCHHVLSWPARDVENFPCHRYLDIISDWPDGFRGKLMLPVLQDMKNLPEEMKDGDVKIKFNDAIYTLDVPEGDRSARKVKNNTEYALFIKFKSQLTALRKDGTFVLDISVHFDQKLKGKVGIAQIEFGKFECPAVVAVPNLPDCREYVKKIGNTFPDGYRAQLYNIPIKSNMNGWNIEMGYSNELFVLEVPQGIRTPTTRNQKMFYIESREYNGALKAGKKFTLKFMVKFDRNKYIKRNMFVNYLRFADFECRST